MEKKSKYLFSILIIACSIMGFIDGILSPDYYIKASAKLLLFLALPSAYYILNKDNSIKILFTFKREQVKWFLLLGVGVFSIILGGYFILSPFFDLTNITKSLENDIGVNKGNFIFVAFYIAIVNSFLEEFFFRGFAFLELKKVTKGNVAMIYSSLFFAFYHVAMIINWGNNLLIGLMVIVLVVAGVIFNLLNEKFNNIYASWIVHMFANLGINLIGFILFEII